jgi:transposase
MNIQLKPNQEQFIQKQLKRGIEPRWLLVESQARKESDLKKLEKKIEQEKNSAQEKIRQLSRREFENRAVALAIAKGLSDSLKYHQLTEIKVNLIPPETRAVKTQIKRRFTLSKLSSSSRIRVEFVRH